MGVEIVPMPAPTRRGDTLEVNIMVTVRLSLGQAGPREDAEQMLVDWARSCLAPRTLMPLEVSLAHSREF